MDAKKTVRKQKRGVSRSTLWFIGIILTLLGMLSRGLIQNRILQVNAGTMEEVLHNLELSGGMTAATTALALEALETCAVPIFAVLTLDGFLKTGDRRKYMLRVLGIAALSEIPYNLALTGQVLDPSSRNPVWGVLICLLMLYLYQHYEGGELTKVLIKIGIFAAALFWGELLNVKFGCVMILLTTLLWGFRRRDSLRYWIAAAAAVCCCVINPLYMFMPFGFLLAYLYNEEKGMQMKLVQYLMYPVMLLLIGAAGYLLA